MYLHQNIVSYMPGFKPPYESRDSTTDRGARPSSGKGGRRENGGCWGIPVPWNLGRWGSAAYGHIDTNWSKPCPNPQGELDQVADTRTTSASCPQTATAAQLLPPPHGSIDVGEVECGYPGRHHHNVPKVNSLACTQPVILRRFH